VTRIGVEVVLAEKAHRRQGDPMAGERLFEGAVIVEQRRIAEERQLQAVEALLSGKRRVLDASIR
jgi:hypothetical protein